MPPLTHDIAGIGPVELRFLPRSRGLRLRVRGERVCLSLPPGLSLSEACTWASQHGPWVREQLERQRQLRCHKQAAGLLVHAPVDRAAAREILTARLSELAGLHGLSHGRVTVRNQKSRWGSCSATGNISLNCRLANLPADLRDYVILHELTHTRHHHHGPAFWTELAQYIEDPRGLSRRLRQYQLT